MCSIGVAYREEHQEEAGRTEETNHWKMSIARLEEMRDNTEERDRLVRKVANVGGEILQRESEGGDLAMVVWGLGGKLLALHKEVAWVTRFFEEQRNIDQVALLEQIARVGVPVALGPGGNLERELAYRNQSSTDKHASEMWEKEVGDVKTGTAIVFRARLAGMVRGLRTNPVGVVEEKGTRRIFHDSTSSGDPEGGEVEGRQVNETTFGDPIPERHLPNVILEKVRGILGLRAIFGAGRRILIQTIDVESAFRQDGEDPAGAVNFGYVLRDFLFIDLPLQFGWRGSPRW